MRTRFLPLLFVLASPVLLFAQAPKPARRPDAKPTAVKLGPLAQCRSDLKNARNDADNCASQAVYFDNENTVNEKVARKLVADLISIRADIDTLASFMESKNPDPGTRERDAIADLQNRDLGIAKGLARIVVAEGEKFSTAYEAYKKLAEENAALRASLDFSLNLLKQDGAALAAANARAAQQANFANSFLLQNMIPKPQPPIRIDVRVTDCNKLPALCLRPQ